MAGHNNVVVLRGNPTNLDSPLGREFVLSCVRSAEGLTDDATVKESYEISDTDWKTVSSNKVLIRAIQAESQRRVNTGQAAAEAAAKILAKGPQVLGEILNDQAQSARSRIECHRELRATVTGTGDTERAANGATFVISIDLSAAGGEVEHYELVEPLRQAIESKTNDDE
jgi:hypothetical protein